MALLSLCLAWLLLGQDASKHLSPPTSAADRVTLRDGSVVLGQVVDPNDRGKFVMVVRRAWAEASLPERARAWQAFERPWLKRASTDRLTRLEQWRRERLAGLEQSPEGDALLRQLAQQIERLKTPDDEQKLPPLMMVAIDRRDVSKAERRPADVARCLRQGWRARFEDVESMSVDDLKDALEGRNFPLGGDDPASIDDLLPLPIEPEARWRARRAATELLNDRSAWFARYGDLMLADNNNMQGLNLSGSLSGLLRSLTGEGPAADPLPPKLRSVAAKGGVGVIVTELQIADDLSGVTVKSSMWVRSNDAPESWQVIGQRASTVRGDQVQANAGANIAADPQVKGIFDLSEGLGLGNITPEMKQHALTIGAATQQALNQTKGAIQEALNKLSLQFDVAR